MIPVASGGLTLSGTPVQTAGLFAFLFACSFFFSGTETALFSLQKLERQRLASAGRTGARVLDLLEDKGRLITSLLIGNESANVLIAAVGSAVVAQVAPRSPWLNVAVLTPAILLFSEITPKILAFRFNLRWSLLAVWPLLVFTTAIAPIRWILSGAVRAMARLFRVTSAASDEALDEAEIRTLIHQGTAAGGVDERERDIIEAVFDFDDLTVGRLMTPRPDVFAVPVTIPWGDLLSSARAHGFSRVPVYDGRLDNVLGVLLIKDLLRYRKQPLTTPRQLRSILLPPVFVPQSKPADDLLREFMQRRFHMAMVVDEHGTFVGVVTLDDLLAELVGEMLDDDDDTSSAVAEIRPGVLTVQGDLDVDDFTEETGIAIPPGEYHTIGGFVFHELGRLPHPGDRVVVDGHAYEVAEMDGRRIGRVRVHRVAGASP